MRATLAPSSYERIIFLLHICELNLIASATFTSSALVAIVPQHLAIYLSLMLGLCSKGGCWLSELTL